MALLDLILTLVMSRGEDLLLVQNMYFVVMGKSQTNGSILRNLLMNGKDADFGYQLQPACRDVSFSFILINAAPVVNFKNCPLCQHLPLGCICSAEHA